MLWSSKVQAASVIAEAALMGEIIFHCDPRLLLVKLLAYLIIFFL